jgi:hypothetical protein
LAWFWCSQSWDSREKIWNLSLPRFGFYFRFLSCFLMFYSVWLIRDINELSRQEVDEIITMCSRKDCVSSSDDIHKR